MHRDIASGLAEPTTPPRAAQPAPEKANAAAFPADATHFPLTIAQTPIALDAMAHPHSPAANTGDIAHIRGNIDTAVFTEAVRRVVAETAALRVSLSHLDGALRQEFPALDDYRLEQRDLSADPRPENSAEKWIEEHFGMPRPWNSFPLFHFALLKIRDGHFVFLQKFHHVLADATGRFQCFQRIAEIYAALVEGVEPPPAQTPPLTIRVAEDAAYLQSQAYQTDLAYWTTRLDNLPEQLVDADRSRSERNRSGRSKRLSHVIAPDEFARLKQAALSLEASVPRLVLALAYVAIARLHGVNDIVIGTPSHNRASQTAKRSIDLAMTVMPFRMTFEGDVAIADMLKIIGSKQMADRRRSRFPFATLLRVHGHQEASQGVFDVLVNYIPATESACLAGADVSYANYAAGFYLPLVIDIRETQDGEGARLTIAFDPGLVDDQDGARLARCLHFLVTNPIDLSQHTIGSLPLFSEEERHHLLVELNDNNVPLPAEETLTSLCKHQAQRTPDAIAVTCGTQSISYAQLDAKAEILAGHLRAAGIGPDVIAAVALPRDISLIVALLAIHKAGGAYLPLDPALPEERIAYMIHDAGAALLVTTKDLARQLPQTSAKYFLLDDQALAAPAPHQAAAVRPENLAYVIYTSGSTGLPKGVAVEHRNAVNLVLFHADRIAAGDLGGILFSSSLSFDASIDEIFVSLVSGGRLIIVETPLSLPSAPARDAVRVLEAAPSVFEALLQVGGFDPGDRLIRFGGEPLTRALADRLFAVSPRVRIENSYGPTETTVDATISTIRRDDRTEPSIGKGLWNTKLYVLGKNMELLPKGAKGELYIGGAGVARGYLNRPELTAERFVSNPFGEGRLYRTGDIVRWRDDGELDFFHRADDQVKINGLRIELGEIERQLETMPEIAQAVALIDSDNRGTKRIFAFALPRNGKSRPGILAVNRHLRSKLPKYMMPAALSWVEKFPLTSSGKLDRKALVLPAWRGPEKSYRAPSNKDEASLAQIWSQVLGISRIGTEDDFFDLGGTSLQAVMIFAKISNLHGFDLPAATVVRAPTIAQQAAMLQEIWRANDRSLLVAFRQTGDGAPLFFVHGGGGGVMYVHDLIQDLQCCNPIYGLHAPPLDGSARLPRTIEDFAAFYIREIRKTQPCGPYNIIGYSAGGAIAYEMARQLRASGETVGLLGLIETSALRFHGSGRKLDAAGQSAAATGRSTLRKTVMKTLREAPNTLRHALGLAVPHDERDDFYMRWFARAESRYAPRPYPGAITVFARKVTADTYRSQWVGLAGGGLIIRELAVAQHLGIVALPTSRFLAAQIDAGLNGFSRRP